jgi:hypothetical protein
MPPDRENGSLAAVERAARKVVLRLGPKLSVVTKWGQPWYTGTDLVMAIYAFQRHVGVEFWRGSTLAPGHPMLEGTGKNLRHVKLRSVDEANSKAFGALVRAAVRLDARSEKRTR